VELTVGPQGLGGVPLGLAGKNVNAINLLFRRRPPFHPPFWVPWHNVASVTEQRRLSMFAGVRVAFREVPHVLHVRGAAGHALSSNCPSELLVRRSVSTLALAVPCSPYARSKQG